MYNTLCYRDYLEEINSMIETKHVKEVRLAGLSARNSTVMTAAQKKYIENKAFQAEYEFYCYDLGKGRINVWNMPLRLRDYKGYLWAMRYASTITQRDVKKKYFVKLFLALSHDNGIGRVMGEGRKLSLLYDMVYYYSGTWCIMDAVHIIPLLETLLFDKGG